MIRLPKHCIAGTVVLILVLINARAIAQCPQNIGFEDGTFNNWQCYAGSINSSGLITLSPTAPLNNRHVMYANSVPQELDYYGRFPVNCPNGSKYSIRLGNSSTGAQAESVSYTFTVPATASDYSIIYNYAVVFENPNHQPIQQPRFTAKVFDATGNTYVGCGSFEFVASGGLPGFKQSLVKSEVYYKPWSPITIKLLGYAGKTITLEFTNNDCTPGGHFGYAYIDVNENCASPITGNTYCVGTGDSLELVAPFGFREYHWYNSNFTTLLGTSNTLILTPPPAIGTEFALEIVPYPGLGCLDTLRTIIKYSGTPFKLSLQDTVTSCSGTPIDLTLPAVTAGSSPGLTFSYFTDLSQLEYLATPSYVTSSGTYYIKGVNSEGCNAIKPITTIINPQINLNLKSSIVVCSPQTVDITSPLLVAGSASDLTYSYWADYDATVPIANPTAINISGTYYVKGYSTSLGCSTVKSILITVGDTPDFNVVNQVSCDKADLTANPVTVLNTPNTLFSYWKDAAATLALDAPQAVAQSGQYYIKATHISTCSTIKPITVTVNPLPVFTIDPAPIVTYPLTTDITSLVKPSGSFTFSYWKNAAATIPVPDATKVDTSGTYYIKAVTVDGCPLVQSINVVIRGIVTSPPNAFSPNGDGINDTWYIPFLKDYYQCKVEVFNRQGQLVYTTVGYSTPWDGRFKGKLLPVGTYYYMINLGMGKDYPSFSGNVSLIY